MVPIRLSGGGARSDGQGMSSPSRALRSSVHRIAVLIAALLIVPTVAATVAPVPMAGASPAWSPGVTDVATGFSFVAPFDAAMSASQRYVFVLDDTNRVVSIDTDTDTATVITQGGEIGFAKRIAVNRVTGDIIVSALDSAGTDPRIVLVDRSTGDQTVLATGFNAAGPVAFDEASGRVLTTKRFGDDDHLVSVDSGGAITDLGRPHYFRDYVGADITEILVDHWGRITVASTNAYCGLYFYDLSLWAYQGSATAPGTFTEHTELWKVGRTALDPVTGMFFGAGGGTGSWDAFDTPTHAVTAFTSSPDPSLGYFGSRAYVCSDQHDRAPKALQPLVVGGGAVAGNEEGSPGKLGNLGGMAVQGGYAGQVNPTQVFVTDTSNNRVAVIVPKKILGFPAERFGGLMSAGQAGDPIDPAYGNFHDTFEDLAPANGAFAMGVARGYNSGDPGRSSLGVGWRAPFTQTMRTDPDGNLRLVLEDGRNVVFRPDGAGGWQQPTEFAGKPVGSPPSSVEYPNGETWTFDALGNLSAMSNWDGQAVSIARVAQGPSVVTSTTGATLTFAYDASDRLSQIAASDGRAVAYGYDPTSGFLASVTGPDGAVTGYETNSVGQITKLTGPTGVVVAENTYDEPGGRVIAQTNPEGSETYTYDDATGDTTVTLSPGGETFTYHHDRWGRMTGVTDGAAHTSTRTYDANGWVASGTDRSSVTNGTTFDAQGNPTSVTEPGVGTTTMAYDAAGRMITLTSPVSGTTTYTYTGTNRIPTTITDALGKVTTQVVSGGLVTSSTDPDGVTVTSTYDPTTRLLTALTDGAGKTTTYEYDTAGRPTKVTTPEGRESTTTYDAAGRVLTTTAPDGGVTTLTYDDAGKVLTATDPTGATTTNTYDGPTGRLLSSAKPGHAPTTYTYDALGQLTKITDPTGEAVETTYGVLGRVTSTKDSAGRVTTYGYTPTGEIATVTAPDGGVTTKTYDPVTGKPASVTDPATRTTSSTYKPNGLVDHTTAPDGGQTVYTYDAVGRVTSVKDPTSRTATTTYTNAGRVASQADAAGVTTSFTYDNAGRLWKSTTPAGTTTVTYTDDGLAASTSTPAGLVSTQTYDAAGRAKVFTDAAGVATTQTWSLRGQLLSKQTSGRGAQQFTYNPDATMATSKDPLGHTTTYSYDAAGRLTGRTTPAGSEAWGYNDGEMVSYTPPILGGVATPTLYGRDAAGRVNVVADPSGRTRTDTYNPAGDLTATAFTDGVTTWNHTYGYDTAGRQTTVNTPQGTYTRAFDTAGRITATNQPDNRYAQYTYDTGGRRQQVTTPEGLELVYSYDSAGRISKITPNASMTDWFTGENGAGADPNKWTRVFVSGGSAAIDTARLRLATTATAGSFAGVTSKAPQTADETATISYQVASTSAADAGIFEVIARQDAAGNNSYRVQAPSNGTTAKLIKRVGGTDTQIGTFTLPAAGSEIRVQLDLSGTTIRAKAWLASGNAPATWGVSVTDSSVTAAGATQLRWSRVAGGPNTVSIDGYRQRNTPASSLTPFVTYTYNADSQVTNEALTGGSRTNTFTNGRLTRQVQTLPGANRTSDLTYDPAGAVDTLAVGGITTDYDYDPSGQLTAATPTSGTALTWAYDAAGRRTSSTTGGVSTSYSYDAKSQLTAITPSGGAPTSITYDPAGRRLNETTGTNTVDYTYNPIGQLATVTRASGGTINTKEDRLYNAEGLLRRDNITGAGGTFLRYLKIDWDATGGPDADMLSWLDGESNIALVNGIAGTVATTKGNTPTAVAQDVYGSTINSTGQTAANATGWDPYGIPTGATTTTKATLGYRGELNVLGDTYLRARQYQATTGSFLTVDPLDDVAGAPTSGNKYHYAYNDPINRTDPSGMRPKDMDTDLGLCRQSGGFGLVTVAAQGGASACIIPPVTRTDGAQCRPPFASDGSGLYYNRKDNSCGTRSNGAAWNERFMETIDGFALAPFRGIYHLGLGFGDFLNDPSLLAKGSNQICKKGCASGYYNFVNDNFNPVLQGVTAAQCVKNTSATGQGQQAGECAFTLFAAVASTYGLKTAANKLANLGGGVPLNPSTVLLDSNVTTGLRADASLGGRILPGEQPGLSYVSLPEMRNAVATPGGLRGVPGAARDLPTISEVPDLNLRINIRAQLPAQPGRFGDGVIGAQAIELGIPLVTNDARLAEVVRRMGGQTR